MVFRSITLFARNRGSDQFWRKRRIFRMSAHFVGRKRNCYSVAVRYVHRALAYTTKSRKLKKIEIKDLWETRLDGACKEFNFSYPILQEMLARSDILLNRKVLTDLAIWEPRTFKSLVSLAWSRAKTEGFKEIHKLPEVPKGVYLRGMLKP